MIHLSPLSYQLSEPGALCISALQGRGLDELKTAVEEEIVRCTGKHIVDLKVDLSTPQLRCVSLLFSCQLLICAHCLTFCTCSWLYKEATVQDVQVNGDDGSAVVSVIISTASYGRYKKLFPE